MNRFLNSCDLQYCVLLTVDRSGHIDNMQFNFFWHPRPVVLIRSLSAQFYLAIFVLNSIATSTAILEIGETHHASRIRV